MVIHNGRGIDQRERGEDTMIITTHVQALTTALNAIDNHLASMLDHGVTPDHQSRPLPLPHTEAKLWIWQRR